MESMFVLSLLVVSTVFSCVALAIGVLALSRGREYLELRTRWQQLTDAYTLAAKEMQQSITVWEGTLDRLEDKVTNLEGSFKKFRSRVNMRQLRERDEPEQETTEAKIVLPSDRPLNEAEKAVLRRTLGMRQMGLEPAAVPRDITED
ncbi:MAG: hypothetical protein ACR2P5_04300 [Gammaproteobacteria bacterium]